MIFSSLSFRYSVVILPQLVNHPNDTLAMDYEMASWVGKIASFDSFSTLLLLLLHLFPFQIEYEIGIIGFRSKR